MNDWIFSWYTVSADSQYSTQNWFLPNIRSYTVKQAIIESRFRLVIKLTLNGHLTDINQNPEIWQDFVFALGNEHVSLPICWTQAPQTGTCSFASVNTNSRQILECLLMPVKCLFGAYVITNLDCPLVKVQWYCFNSWICLSRIVYNFHLVSFWHEICSISFCVQLRGFVTVVAKINKICKKKDGHLAVQTWFLVLTQLSIRWQAFSNSAVIEIVV